MKTKEFSNVVCCVTPVVFLALFAVLMPFIAVADVLGASKFTIPLFFKIGIVVIMFVAFYMMYYQTKRLKT